ncbi:hypothetical protein HRbin34_00551 [bacterium HR34]|nr:hypothetical protein HRbin34_00551 [bacterium HR34]
MAKAEKILKTKNLLIALVLVFLYPLSSAFSQMQSASYKITDDVIGSGGLESSSVNYKVNDTVGEFGIENISSASYKIKAGFWQKTTSFISMSISSSSVSLLPNIGGVTGGVANGSTDITILTDSPTGYELKVKASSTPALQSGSYSFSDFSQTPSFWSVASNSSAFGFSPQGNDVIIAFKDNGSSCGVGTNTGNCYRGFNGTNEILIASLSSPTNSSGSITTLKFRAESGSNNIQPDGLYTATITISALAY